MTAPTTTTPTATGNHAGGLSPEHLLEALEQFPGVYWTADAALRLTAVGGAGLRDQGFDPAQMVGTWVGDLPYVSASVVEIHRAAVQEGRDGSYEIRYGERDFTARVRPFRGADGSAMGVVGIATDVTERVQAEAELRARERELASLTDHAPDIMVRFDRELRHLYISPAVEVSTGLPPEHFFGKTNRELTMPEDLCRLWEQELNAVFESGEPRRFAFEWPGPTASRWFEASVVPELGPDGRVETVLSATRDSTETRRVEEERAASEGRYRDLFERAMDMIYALDRDGRFTEVNPAFQRVLGYSRGELVGQHFSLVIPADEVPAASERFRRKLAGLDWVTVYESTFRRKDGQEIAVEVSSQTLPGSDGPAGVVTISRDVTAERRTRRALEASERRFRGAFDDAAVGMVLTDPAGQILRVNPAFAEMLGYRPEDLQGRPIEEFAHPDDHQEVVEDVLLMIEGLKDRRIADKRYVRRDGRLVHAHIGVSPVRDEDGAVAMFIAQVEDVTELRRVQRELAESERLRLALVENARDLLMVLDLEGTVRLASRSIEEILGHRPDEVVGRSLHELIHPDDYDALWCQLTEAATGADPGTAITRARASDGSFVPLEGLLGAANRDDGRPAFLVVGARDVRERLQLEEQLRRAQKLEAVGRLAGGIAHDFNNLLLAIRGNGELALRNLEHERPAAVDEVREILEAADRAANLTRQLLAFSRRQMLCPDVLDLREVVAEMVKLLRRVIGENVELTTVWPDEPAWVEADRGQLEQVVANLAVNAREAMPAGGQLRFEIAHRDGQVVLWVSDSGVGMDEETASRVFEPFFTSKAEGTGLGLATVHGIVTQSGGEITFTTAPGVGTTFEVTLPQTDRSPSPPSMPAPGRAESGVETILVVEDEPAVRDVVSRMLESLGYAVVAAPSGDEALATGRVEGKVDLLLTDMMMRGLDGHTTAARLRELQPQLRVLYMSGYTGDAVLQPDELPSSTAFLQKPFTADELALAVRRLLDNR